MNHYTYLLQSKTDDMMYIGVRSCDGLVEEDNYWGSSRHLPNGKGGNLKSVCDKFILGRFESRKDALQDEIRRHRINDVAVSKLFWNRAIQTSTGFDTTGVASWNKDKEFSEESRLKMSESRKGMKLTNETKSKISKGNLGKPKHNADSRRRISEGNKNKVINAVTRAKMSEARTGVKQPITTCPHCDKTGGQRAMTRYHFENCKIKGDTICG